MRNRWLRYRPVRTGRTTIRRTSSPDFKPTPPWRSAAPFWTAILCAAVFGAAAHAGKLRLTLENGQDVVEVGAINRWDQDGNARIPLNSKAQIDKPACSAKALRKNKTEWVFADLPPGRYDLVVMLRSRTRIEGFHYPPVLEFDDLMLHAEAPEKEVQKTVVTAIEQSKHYENNVQPLYLAGDSHCVRVLVQLLRDKATSYDAEYGQPVATLRHEVWQFTHRYGAWTKEQRTRVLDRILMGRAELRRWTWIWAPELGGIKIDQDNETTVRFKIPKKFTASTCRGLLPD